MKIGILSRDVTLYSTSRLKEAAEARGHQVDVIDYLRCYVNITAKKSHIYYKGEKLPNYDAIIPRIGAKRTFYGAALVRQFETGGTFCLNSSLAITRSRDKLRSLQLLSRKGIGLPATGFAYSLDDVENLINEVGEAPLVIKLLEGSQGVGVILTETKKAAESVMQAFMGVNANILIQEFIEEAKSSDIRCLVLGDTVIAAMKRQAAPGEFRSNLHRKGIAENIKITAVERNTAIKAAKIMGLKFSGVDLLRSSKGPLVMEVNSSAGFEGIESIVGKNIAEQVINYIEKNARPTDPKQWFEN